MIPGKPFIHFVSASSPKNGGNNHSYFIWLFWGLTHVRHLVTSIYVLIINNHWVFNSDKWKVKTENHPVDLLRCRSPVIFMMWLSMSQKLDRRWRREDIYLRETYLRTYRQIYLTFILQYCRKKQPCVFGSGSTQNNHPLQMFRCSNPWKLWICYLIWQKGFCRCDYVKDLEWGDYPRLYTI